MRTYRSLPAIEARAGLGTRLGAACVLGAIAACLLLLIGRLGKLQIANSDEYRRLADRQQSLERRLSARRGNIYDREGRLLASSVQRWSVYADPKAATRPEAAVSSLGRILDIPLADIRRKLRRDSCFVWIKRQVTDEQAARIRSLDLPGVHMRRESKRVYSQGNLAAHVIGFTDVDGRGLAGVERKMDALLRGRTGLESVLCDGGRRIIRSAQDRIQKPSFDGYDIRLTLDTYIQAIAEEELATAVAMHKPECGTAVVMDCRDGSVLAMASWPAFNPQAPNDSPVGHQRNIAISDCYEFGSVFKPISVGIALQAGAVAADRTFDCHRGEWRIGRRTVHDAHPYSMLTVGEIICYSSNIGAAQISLELGREGLCDGVREFGFGGPSGIALPGETGGIVRPLRVWNRYSVVSVAFGQELATTPLAIARAFTVFANKGLLLQPRIVESIVHSHTGEVVYTAGDPVVAGRPLDPAVAEAMLAMLRRVVTDGTGRRAKLDEYAIAGKTGTAQLLRPDGRGYSHSRYLSSFIGIAPSEQGRIVVLVSLKAPTQNGYYGGVAAAPAVRNIVQRTLRYMKVPPAKPPAATLGDPL